ncbi:hypothetical protein LK12_17085 [Novosphingobium malaysiense]|uniref:Uncharacterized protein n=1 Tax=Novosphingobium malaysiense TaxID=1348853 RepID=A0A0B1ZIH2_9SPHN|nr:hypothetical protein LK12_17085 [Novosphingobium malaysiense]
MLGDLCNQDNFVTAWSVSEGGMVLEANHPFAWRGIEITASGARLVAGFPLPPSHELKFR